jgi:hypothetical protein
VLRSGLLSATELDLNQPCLWEPDLVVRTHSPLSIGGTPPPVAGGVGGSALSAAHSEYERLLEAVRLHLVAGLPLVLSVTFLYIRTTRWGSPFS